MAARRQARYEARNIRMRELEKKQKEEEETNNHSLIQHTSSTNSNHNHSNIHSGRRERLFFCTLSTEGFRSTLCESNLHIYF